MNKYTLNILALLSVTMLSQPAVSAVDKSPDIVREGAVTGDKKAMNDALIANEKGQQKAETNKDLKDTEKGATQNPVKSGEPKETAGADDKAKPGNAEDALSEYPGMIAAEKDPKIKAELTKEYNEEKALLEGKSSKDNASEAGDLGEDAELKKSLEKEENALDKESKKEAEFNAELEKELDKDIKAQDELDKNDPDKPLMDALDKNDPDLKKDPDQGAGATGGGGSSD